MPIKDTRLIAKALEQRWPVPKDLRASLVRQMMVIIADKSASPRERTSAFKALLAAEKQNQDDEHKVLDATLQHRDAKLSAIARELGIDPSLIVDATNQPDSSSEGLEDVSGQQ